MELPRPEPGLVISYSYLWRREFDRAREEGAKNRPCVIMLATSKPAGLEILVAPMTTAAPLEDQRVIEVPPRVMGALGLGGRRSWIVTDEVNRFLWPGFDLRPAEGGSRCDYGFIPPRLFDRAVSQILQAARAGRLDMVPRD